jgi:hypothetical protein
MPAILERLVSQLKAKGKSTSSAYAIATSTLQKSGDLKGSKATAKGAKRGKMTPAARAKDRASKKSKHSVKDYKYNARSNLATLKGKK